MNPFPALRTRLLLQTAVLFAIIVFWPIATRNIAFGIIVSIRTAIITGNDSLLINSAIQNCMLFMIPSIGMYMSLEMIGMTLSSWLLHDKRDHLIFIAGMYCLILVGIKRLEYYPIEIATTAIGMFITLLLVYYSSCENNAFLPKLFISLQVFFLIQWINIIPEFAKFQIGKNDLSISLKIAAQHLSSNMTHIALLYMAPLIVSALLTTLLIRLYIQNMKVAEEKHQKERAFEDMQQQMMNNRIYQEINALAHDLKTPLATIQGLTSLLVLSKDVEKIESYGTRIETSISKMSDMISSFLYDDAREVIHVTHLLQYIQAQVPVDRDDIVLEVKIEDGLPPIEVNKIRMARALVNILENAILVPTGDKKKHICFSAKRVDDHVLISISDNGMGIKTENLERIWDIGYSGKNTSGLGLPFAKQTVSENNGEIYLESDFGHGTTVFIRLPMSLKERDYEEN